MRSSDLFRLFEGRTRDPEDPVPYWTAIGVPDFPVSPGWRGGSGEQIFQTQPQRLFRGHYLIVTTPGWHILDARTGNTSFLAGIDGDAYSRSEHDRLERMGQLERHQIKFVIQVGNLLTFVVKPHYPKLRTDRPFTAVIIGQSLESNY